MASPNSRGVVAQQLCATLLRLAIGGGGGGVGDPHRRDPLAVADDVRNGFVTLTSARDVYGVVVDPATFTVDIAASAALRAGGRAAGSETAGG